MSTRPLERPNNPSPVSQTVKVTGEAIEVAEIPYGDLAMPAKELIERVSKVLDNSKIETTFDEVIKDIDHLLRRVRYQMSNEPHGLISNGGRTNNEERRHMVAKFVHQLRTCEIEIQKNDNSFAKKAREFLRDDNSAQWVRQFFEPRPRCHYSLREEKAHVGVPSNGGSNMLGPFKRRRIGNIESGSCNTMYDRHTLRRDQSTGDEPDSNASFGFTCTKTDSGRSLAQQERTHKAGTDIASAAVAAIEFESVSRAPTEQRPVEVQINCADTGIGRDIVAATPPRSFPSDDSLPTSPWASPKAPEQSIMSDQQLEDGQAPVLDRSNRAPWELLSPSRRSHRRSASENDLDAGIYIHAGERIRPLQVFNSSDERIEVVGSAVKDRRTVKVYHVPPESFFVLIVQKKVVRWGAAVGFLGFVGLVSFTAYYASNFRRPVVQVIPGTSI